MLGGSGQNRAGAGTGKSDSDCTFGGGYAAARTRESDAGRPGAVKTELLGSAGTAADVAGSLFNELESALSGQAPTAYPADPFMAAPGSLGGAGERWSRAGLGTPTSDPADPFAAAPGSSGAGGERGAWAVAGVGLAQEPYVDPFAAADVEYDRGVGGSVLPPGGPLSALVDAPRTQVVGVARLGFGEVPGLPSSPATPSGGDGWGGMVAGPAAPRSPLAPAAAAHLAGSPAPKLGPAGSPSPARRTSAMVSGSAQADRGADVWACSESAAPPEASGGSFSGRGSGPGSGGGSGGSGGGRNAVSTSFGTPAARRDGEEAGLRGGGGLQAWDDGAAERKGSGGLRGSPPPPPYPGGQVRQSLQIHTHTTQVQHGAIQLPFMLRYKHTYSLLAIKQVVMNAVQLCKK